MIDTTNSSNINTESDNEEIPFPLSRIIRYSDNIITFEFNYLKLKQQMDCYYYNEGIINRFK